MAYTQEPVEPGNDPPYFEESRARGNEWKHTRNKSMEWPWLPSRQGRGRRGMNPRTGHRTEPPMSNRNSREPPLIRVRGLSRIYPEQRGVHSLHFTLHRGEVLVLLGPNGAGKTTTLSMLCTMLAPHGGSIQIAGFDLARSPRQAKRALGYLPDPPPLYPEMTIKQYLGFCARLHGISRRETPAAVATACRLTGLTAVENRLIEHLSRGYRQRAGIAQALVHQPEVVILDEPTAGLDPLEAHRIRALIGELRRDHGILLSTHLLAEAAAIATRVLILDHGHIVHETRLDHPGAAPLRLRLNLGAPPDESRLGTIPGVAAVETLDAGNFLLLAEPGHDPREAIVRAALDYHWKILALAPHHPSLENLFLRVIAGRETA